MPNYADFEDFAERVDRAAFLYAWQRLGCDTDADDALQEAYLRTLPHWDKVMSMQNSRSYFFKILTNVITEHYRRTARNQRILRDASAKLIDEHGYNGPALPLTDSAPSAATVLDSLTDPRQRQIAELMMDGCWDIVDYAEENGLDPNSVQALARTVRSKLRRQAVALGLIPPQPDARQADELPPPQPADGQQRVNVAMEGLPRRERQIMRLTRIGTTPAQIAQQLGISANNARVTLCHARKRLCSLLGVTADELEELLRPRYVPDTRPSGCYFPGFAPAA